MAGPRLINTTLRKFISTTQGKSYTVGAVTILLVLIIFLAGVFPAVSSILFQAQQNGERSAALERIEEKRQTLRALSVEEEQKRAISLSLNANLPDTLDQTSIFDAITNMVRSVGCQLVSVTFNEMEIRRSLVNVFNSAPALDGKSMSVSVEGERAQMESLLELMENSRRILNITGLTISTLQGEEDVSLNRFRMDLQAEIYFWNTEKPIV